MPANCRKLLVHDHRSAFFHPVNATLGLDYPPFSDPGRAEKTAKWNFLYGMSDDKLVCFIGHLATVLPDTKFLIYSRGTDPNWKDEKFRNSWTTNCMQRFSALKDRVFTMLVQPSTIPGSEKGSFKDPKTAKEVRDLVKEILNLP
jgi:hypothetical protein